MCDDLFGFEALHHSHEIRRVFKMWNKISTYQVA